MAASASYRENSQRSIYIDAVIDQELVRRLTPIILDLRQAGTDPITVYIDSPGGYTRCADVLSNILTAPDPDGTCYTIITVVTGTAASAAADFLASGNYVLAYPNTTVHFHGTRQGAGQDLTMEAAAYTARWLRDYNDIIAINLAKRVIERSLFVYLTLRDGFDDIRKDKNLPNLALVECFAEALYTKLSYNSHALCSNALNKYKESQKISDFTFNKAKTKTTDSLGKLEGKLLKALIDREVVSGKSNPDWRFSEDTLNRCIEDFRLMQDYYGGNHIRWLNPAVLRVGRYFLTKEELDILDTKAWNSQSEKDQWVINKASPAFRPIWYFVVSLCRLLQQRENILTAYDAYWLGMVDEVLGSNLPCLRTLVENPPSNLPA